MSANVSMSYIQFNQLVEQQMMTRRKTESVLNNFLLCRKKSYIWETSLHQIMIKC